MQMASIATGLTVLRRGCRPAVQASATASSSHTRVLRYPNGITRKIRYPVTSAPVEDVVSSPKPAFETANYEGSGLSPEELDEWWSPIEEEDSPLQFDECDLWGASCNPAFYDEKKIETEPQGVESFSFEEQLALQSANVEELVRASYQVLQGSPWLLPKPLHVLASARQSLHCLQVRFLKEDVQDELAMVLKRPDLSSKITVAQMKDGVVAFETAEDAARYATYLEADIDGEVDVMQLDSNKLFLNATDVDAVVVYLAGGNNFLPMPYQLSNSLRSFECNRE